jgi:hypothetical protein
MILSTMTWSHFLPAEVQLLLVFYVGAPHVHTRCLLFKLGVKLFQIPNSFSLVNFLSLKISKNWNENCSNSNLFKLEIFVKLKLFRIWFFKFAKAENRRENCPVKIKKTVKQKTWNAYWAILLWNALGQFLTLKASNRNRPRAS